MVDVLGGAHMRSGVCREKPMGSGWLAFEQGGVEGGIRQVSMGSCTMWALDGRGNVYLREGVDAGRPQGSVWRSLAASPSMVNISVSFTEQVRANRIVVMICM